MSTPLSELVQLVHVNVDFSSKLISLVERETRTVLTKIKGSAPTSQRSYATVQTGEDADIELNSDLVYCNHSCDPSVIFDMNKLEVLVLSGRPLRKGDDITFFYPSTEWDMQQPFECHCGSKRCLGVVSGTKHLDQAKLRQYWLNPHIERLLANMKPSEKNHMAGDTSQFTANGELKN